MAKCRNFTMVELLVVIGIILILTGILLPAVIGGQRRGQITQAKSDMTAIKMAMKAMKNTYGKFATISGSNYGWYGLGSAANGTSSNFTVTIGADSVTANQVRVGGTNPTRETDAYNNLIIELCLPARIENASKINTNKRKLKLLEPPADFDPASPIPEKLWRDPWGTPYVILFNVNGTDVVSPRAGVVLQSDVELYSYGPNATDNFGENEAFNNGTRNTDDITTWDK